jgi:uroporphyrinogen decarboxylase
MPVGIKLPVALVEEGIYMNTYKKLYNLLHGEGSQKSVFFHPILMHFAARFYNMTYSQFARDYRILVSSNVACAEFFGHDAVSLISDPYRETSAFGAGVDFPEDSVPLCKERIVHTVEDVKALKNPDVYKEERTLDRIKGAEYYKKLLGDSVPIIGWIEGPLAEACDLAGDSHVLMQSLLRPDFVRLLMDKCLRTARDFAEAQIRAGCTVMGVGDAICSQISPQLYENLVFPLHVELFDFIHSLGAFVKLHICGNITHLLPKLRDTGADIIDVDWMVDIDEAHRELGDSVVVCGNLDPVSVIQDLDAGEVYTKTKQLILAQKGKRFILSGGCEITVNTPFDNVKKMGEAAREGYTS